jgi:tRNA A37 threonylcarbamoyladenosine dehydratase
VDRARRFGGIARLYGEQGLAALQAARVTVIGVGGVGSWAVEALARSGIGGLRLIDPDHVVESNVNRQLPAITPEFGKAKVAVLRDRIAAINPECRVETVEQWLTQDNAADLLDGDTDWVIDCVDAFRVKAALIALCRGRRQPLVTVGGAGGQVDPSRVRSTDLRRTEQDPLLARTRRLLRQDYGFPRNPRRSFGVPCVWSDEPQRAPPPTCGVAHDSSLNCAGFGACMPVTATFGMVAAGQVVTAIARRARSG